MGGPATDVDTTTMGVTAPRVSTATVVRARLVLLTFLMLFVELALIRWLGANVVYLAYFSNIVLLGSFLGIGLGFLRAGRSNVALLPWTPLALAVMVGAAWILKPTVGIQGGTLIFFGLDTSGPPRWLVLPIIFVCVATVLMCIGDGVARTFAQLRNLDAYHFDLVGSLLGSAGFALLAFLNGVPLVWGTVFAVGIGVAIWPRTARQLLATVLPLAVLLGVLAAESFQSDTVWTPYYKTEAVPINDDANSGYKAEVNGVPTWYQYSATDDEIYKTTYDRMADGDPGDVLIIGAGSGNDVSVALHNGARHVDAVEIDAHLLDLGRRHPDRPYDDPRVTTHVNDGRAYIERTDRTWDTILLALPDSLTLLQGNSSVRLESYLFTREAADVYRDRLAPDGVFSMYNYYRESWLVDRYAGTLEEAFGNAPCVNEVRDSLSILTVSADPSAIDCPAANQWQRGDDVPAPATDDRPFPYLREPTIPAFYLAAIALMLAVSIVAIRVFGGPFKGMRAYADLFFLGVAFLLLETKHVVQFALLFGTTWFVNALVFIGVLGSVLLAVAVSKRVRIQRVGALYVALLAAVALAWVIPGSALLDLDPVPRFVAAVVLAFLPIFTANMVFAQRFRDTADSTSAFGANLLGAMVGGLLEYSSLMIGYRNLLLVVAVVYGLAFLTGRRTLTAPT